jgi:hypothetical protein
MSKNIVVVVVRWEGSRKEQGKDQKNINQTKVNSLI